MTSTKRLRPVCPGSLGGIMFGACMVPIRRGVTRVDEEEEASVSDTEENKALVRRFFEAQNRGDLAAVEGMMTLDFVNHHRS